MGLLDQAQTGAPVPPVPADQAQAQAPAQQPAEQAAPGQGEGMKLDPSQQQQVDLICNQATDFIMLDENINHLDSMVKSSSPEQAIADMASTVLNGIYTAAQQAGKTIPQDIISIAGAQIALLFAAVIANEGLIDIKQMQDVAQKAYDIAVQKHNAKFAQPGQMPEQGV